MIEVRRVLDSIYDKREISSDELLAAYKRFQKMENALVNIASGNTTRGDDLIEIAKDAIR